MVEEHTTITQDPGASRKEKFVYHSGIIGSVLGMALFAGSAGYATYQKNILNPYHNEPSVKKMLILMYEEEALKNKLNKKRSGNEIYQENSSHQDLENPAHLREGKIADLEHMLQDTQKTLKVLNNDEYVIRYQSCNKEQEEDIRATTNYAITGAVISFVSLIGATVLLEAFQRRKR